MIPPIGKIQAWSLVYFLKYAYFDIQPSPNNYETPSTLCHLLKLIKKTNHVHHVAESVEIESKGIKDFADFYSCEVRSGRIINASSRPFGR